MSHLPGSTNGTQYQIMDFQDTLQKCIDDEQKVYGRKNKPRAEEPSMFNILTWKDGEEELWNYTKRTKELLDSNTANRLKYKINKSHSHWTTENMDQYRKFAYSPSKKPVFFDLEDPADTRGKVTTYGENFVSKDVIEQFSKSAQRPQSSQSRQIPENPSEFIDKYTIQDMNNLNDVLRVIQNRALVKGGEVVRNPIAQQVSEIYERETRHGATGHGQEGYYDEEQEGQEYNGEENQDKESEDVEVEKLNLTNVKSRLLEKKVKSAKILDPVYEKDRLNRRKDRIKRLNETTRWLPNSAFKTYFGKAPFENYGRGNVNPTVGGTIYGDYLKSHNVNPHSGGNKPEYQQVYGHADFAATRYPDCIPEPPRKCKDDFRLSQKQVEELKRRNPLVAEKFSDKPKTIVKPDLVNTLRFASEENTPDASFEEEKPKSKNLRESLKNLNKKARAIRKEHSKHSESSRARSEPKKKKQQQQQQQQNTLLKSQDWEETSKASSIPKSEKTAPAQQAAAGQTKKAQVAQEQPKKAKVAQEQPVEKQTAKPVAAQQQQQQQATIRPQTADAGRTRQEPRQEFVPVQQEIVRKTFNASEGVTGVMRDPETAFQESPNKKNVTFKEAPQFRESLQKKAPVFEQTVSERPQTANLNFKKVEGLQTLIKDLQKNEKLIEKINEDLGGSLNVNPMEPPKNYLFTLSQKETDPRYYKNVPAVWLQRIPYAGRKSGKHEDVKAIFNPSD